MSNDDDKRLQTFDWVTSYLYDPCVRIVSKKKYDDVTGESTHKRNFYWPQILDHSYRILIFVGSWSGKTNAIVNLINHVEDIDKIYWYTEDLNQAIYYLLINK